METRRGRGSGAFVLGVDRLVLIIVIQFFMDVWRRGHLADLVQEAVEIAIIVEFHQAATEFGLVKHFAIAILCKFDFYARQCFAARVHENFPGVIALRRQEKHLHLAAGVSLFAIETSRDDFRIVENENVPFFDFVQNIPEGVVLPLSGLFIYHHEPARIPRLRRFLGDQFFGQIIIKFL